MTPPRSPRVPPTKVPVPAIKLHGPDILEEQASLIADLKDRLKAKQSALGGLQRRLEYFGATIRDLEAARDLALQEVDRLRAAVAAPAVVAPPVCTTPHVERQRLPDERWSSTKTFRVGGREDGVSAHLHAGERADGAFGEVFVRLGPCVPKNRADVDWQALATRLSYLARVFVDAWATAVSLGAQHGVPLEVYLSKHMYQTDVPGYTGDTEFPRVNGLLDFISRWLQKKYCAADGKVPPAVP